MQINLFKCNAEKNRVDKSDFLNGRFVIEGFLKDKTSITNPVIIIEKENNPVTYDYNYMYIGEFKRYYFINDIRNVNKNMWEISATVDVLFSFLTDIKTSYGIIDKYEIQTLSNVYLNDGSFVMDTRKYNQVIPFSNGFNDNGSYILICAGGHA